MPKKINSDVKIILVVALAFAIVSIVLYNIEFESDITPTTTTTTTTLQPNLRDSGTLVVVFKDDAHKIPGGGVVTSMNFTVTSVELLRNGSSDWEYVFSGEKRLDILKYTETFAKISEAELDAGNYTSLRVGFSDGSISVKNTLTGVYTPKTYSLIVPEIREFSQIFEIGAAETITLVVDFDIGQSVTRTSEGYMFNPIVFIEEHYGRLSNVDAV